MGRSLKSALFTMHLLWLPRPCLLLSCCLCQQTAGRHMVPERTPNILLLAEIHLLFLSRVQPAQQGSLSNRVRGSWCYRFGFLWVSGFFLTCVKKCFTGLYICSLSLSLFLVLFVTTYRCCGGTEKINKLRHALHCLHSTK